MQRTLRIIKSVAPVVSYPIEVRGAAVVANAEEAAVKGKVQAVHTLQVEVPGGEVGKHGPVEEKEII